MSEYWKSTPKYWCKHCSTFVRDTKLEKTNHEATPKHQGNLKRFLRDLHRGHEKGEKDKERAKSEVARLNGLVGGAGSGDGTGSTSSVAASTPRPSGPKPQATASQRKQQLAQLAEMGVSIPDEFRPDMAMAGEWEVTSERIIEDESEKKPEARALGVRKRQIDDAEEAELEAQKRRWGSTYRIHPEPDQDVDLDALLSNATRKSTVIKTEHSEAGIKGEIKTEVSLGNVDSLRETDNGDNLGIKKTLSNEEVTNLAAIPAAIVNEDLEAVPGVVFKKRKTKNIRQK